MKSTAWHWALKLNKKIKTWEILHLSWATITGMDIYDILYPY